ncbi:BsuPI-related putative proteinase inhibitor [Pontibacillus yanchengensis]|uniref:Intracellular proteinase inhibitor BsuPI domain-containing protein n=1 Tax=Pontibacillus yanchengensis Y32 TaxID=1385514 RepID=A0A0A2T5L3_9BACI|nr:BsuPI-related putative proteinase inhibitor [Pontibacillus yanchengensis]KGP71092.1 hypothetical protein N782_01525 [Pontibacillus yanchengensis Y32]
MKKLLVLVMALILVAAGCSSSSKANDTENQESQDNQTEETSSNASEEEENKDEQNKEEEKSEEKKTDVLSVKELLQQQEMSASANAKTEQVTFDFSLKNTTDKDVELGFSSGQQYEIVVKNAKDEEVYRYSQGKAFTEALTSKKVKAGESVAWKQAWNYKKEDKRVEPGKYTAEITLVPNKINGKTIEAKPFQQTVEFEVVSEDQAFRNIKVEGSNGDYTVTGEARVFEASFLYNVEDGHNVLVNETAVQADQGAPNWGKFEFDVTIAKDKLPSNGTLTMMMYTKSAKDGSIENVKYVKLETFK